MGEIDIVVHMCDELKLGCYVNLNLVVVMSEFVAWACHLVDNKLHEFVMLFDNLSELWEILESDVLPHQARCEFINDTLADWVVFEGGGYGSLYANEFHSTFATLNEAILLVVAATEVYPRFLMVQRKREVYTCNGGSGSWVANGGMKVDVDAPLLFEDMLIQQLGNSAVMSMTIEWFEHHVFDTSFLEVSSASVVLIFGEHYNMANDVAKNRELDCLVVCDDVGRSIARIVGIFLGRLLATHWDMLLDYMLEWTMISSMLEADKSPILIHGCVFLGGSVKIDEVLLCSHSFS